MTDLVPSMEELENFTKNIFQTLTCDTSTCMNNINANTDV